MKTSDSLGPPQDAEYSALAALVSELENDAHLAEPSRFRARVAALDALEDFRLDDPAARVGGSRRCSELYGRARGLRTRLQTCNDQVCDSIRADVIAGNGAASLRDWVPAAPGSSRNLESADGDRYDYLDVLVTGVLRPSVGSAKIAELPIQMVPYQPTPARHIFDLIERTALNEHDVLVDLGSGLGHVPLLASICTDARSVGVEIQAAYVEAARRSGRRLNLRAVSFLQEDARVADVSDGTVFYLYTPFLGNVLREVLDRLRREARKRAIRVCTLGPCTPIVAEEPWLDVVADAQTDHVTIFRSESSTGVAR